MAAIATIAGQAAEGAIAIAAGTSIASRHGATVRVRDRSIDDGAIATFSAATAAINDLAPATLPANAAAAAKDYAGIGCRRGYNRTVRTTAATATALPTIG